MSRNIITSPLNRIILVIASPLTMKNRMSTRLTWDNPEKDSHLISTSKLSNEDLEELKK